MSRRLFHFLLAVVVAFVFTGRMEAAASHCRSLAAPADMATTMPMGDMPGMAGMDMNMDMATMPDCHGAEQPAKQHAPANDPCECLALLTADFPVVETAQKSTRIAPFVWQAPATAAIISFDRAPDGPPPKS
jgi:hypothetical protein